MKTIAVLPLAAVLALGLASAAQAFVSVEDFQASADRAPIASMHSFDHWHAHPTCVGLSSGTAHHSCGTATGGPSGGLH